MSRPRLLDLFSGAGGAGMGYHLAGWEVVGVDIKPQLNYPFEFHQADALSFPLDGFDAVHASPPCQQFTAYRRRGQGVGDSAPDLIVPIRRRLRVQGAPYVIENVPGAPLHQPIQLCGSSFGLDVRRHRWFELGWCNPLAPPCDHGWQTPRFPQATNRSNLRSTVEVGAWRCVTLAPAAMGIDWMTNAELSQAVPPAYTEWIGSRIMAAAA